MEQFFRIGAFSLSPKVYIRTQVTVDNRNLLLFIIFVCYYLTPGSIRLIRR